MLRILLRVKNLLVYMSVKNIFLIENIEIDFSSKLTVLTGETGVGKSILLDVLSFAVGFNNKKNILKSQQKDGEVIVEFLFKENKIINKIFKEAGFEPTNNLIIRRVIQKNNNRVKSYINEKNCSQEFLKRVSSNLLDIQNQNDSQGLFERSNHRKILDQYGNYSDQILKTKESWLKFNQNLEKLKKEKTELGSLSDFEKLHNSIEEIDNLKIKKNEFLDLHERRKFLNNLKVNQKKIFDSRELIESNIVDRNIISSIKKLQSFETSDKNLKNIINLLDNILIDIEEVRKYLDVTLENITYDNQELKIIEERISVLLSISRKYNIHEDFLFEENEKNKNKFQKFEQKKINISILESDLEISKKEFSNNCKKLTERRFEAANSLDNDIKNELKFLNLEKVDFKTSFSSIEESKFGKDKISFMIKTNPGSPYGDLADIASGGELSRLFLAIKVSLTKKDDALTIIFDEIDRGVGGATAEAVGERLSVLAKKSQILVVTHSPQVAGHASTHFKLEKLSNKKGYNETFIKCLTNEERIEEIARMLSGYEITEEAKKMAKLMIK